MADPTPRQQFEFTLTTVDRGKIVVTMVDRITVDDVFLHLVNREVYRVITRDDPGEEVSPLFKDFLLKERFTAGQN
jgi:hypothetical protein